MSRRRGLPTLLLTILIVPALLAAGQPAMAFSEEARETSAVENSSQIAIQLPEVVSFTITPTTLESNRINWVTVKVRFRNDGLNLQGGNLFIIFSASEDCRFEPGYQIHTEGKKFNKRKGVFKVQIPILAEVPTPFELTAHFRLPDGVTRGPVSDPVTLTCEAKPGNVEQGHRKGMIAYDFTLLDQKGKKVSLSDYLGSVVLIDFCSEGCSVCQGEAQTHEELHQRYGESGFVILTVLTRDASGNPATKTDCKQWAKTFGLSSPVLNDPTMGVYCAYLYGPDMYKRPMQGTEAVYPRNVLIDRNGGIRLIMEGYNRKKIERYIRKLLRQ